MHLDTLLNILMPRQVHLNAKCHEVELMVKLLNINVILHIPQNRVLSDTITQVTLKTVNDVMKD